MASSTTYDVHLGFWTNWEHGSSIQGATVTLTRQQGGFLIAFLAIFVGMVGKSFWRLGCFALHRFYSSSDARDGLHHQRQAILRNSDTAQDGAWRLLMSMIAWRSGQRARQPILRLLPLILFAFTVSAAFGIASIFSSNVTSETTNQVLLTGARCGVVDANRPDEEVRVYKQLTLLMANRAESANRFLNYGMQCYTNSTNTDGCNLYVKPKLPLLSKRGWPCPFGDDICKLKDDNLVMDTGYLDSVSDLGINSQTKHRFQLRLVNQCAPLKTQGYMEPYHDPDYGSVMRYMYGNVINPKGVLNWTHELPVNGAYLPGDGSASSNIPRLDYNLGVELHSGAANQSMLPPGENRWDPIPALSRIDADVHLIFLSAPEIHFAAPVNDPFFSARRNATEIHDQKSGETMSAWLQDEPLGVMGCTAQYQYCNPHLPEGERCEPLRGLKDPLKSQTVKNIFPDDSHFKTVEWAENQWTSSVFDMADMIAFIGAAALRARNGLSYGYSGPLPDNQWQLEAEHWAKGALASLQDAFVTTTNGIPHPLEDFRRPPAANDSTARNLCANQKVLSTSFSSFNVLGMSLILTLGSLIIALDMGLEPAVARWQHRRYMRARLHEELDEAPEKQGHALYGALEWSHTSTLQLQRLAHEELGYGTWTRCAGDTPVTQAGEALSALDLHDISHPVLKGGSRKLEHGPPREDDSSVAPPSQAWGLKKSDTGLETLVEGLEDEKVGGKEMAGEEDVEVVVRVVSAKDGGSGETVERDSMVIDAMDKDNDSRSSH